MRDHIKLEVYGTRARCPKCRADWIVPRLKPTYCDGTDCRFLGHHIPKLATEHLHNTCPACSYVELMECADAEPPDDEHSTVYCPVDVDCPHCTERVELAIKIRCTNPDCFTVGDKASVDVIVMGET